MIAFLKQTACVAGNPGSARNFNSSTVIALADTSKFANTTRMDTL
ncbi:MAG TPA: hypothetical protein PK074_08075 [Spirochaetales bacterium]|nr:hypothetical protein [Spirochaetales bacterium]